MFARLLALIGLAFAASACADDEDFPAAELPADAGPGADGSSAEMPLEEGGGVLFLPHCGYAVVTRTGATPPWPAPPEARGADPTPKHIHLGVGGDPARGMAIVWRSRDETTLAASVRYGVERTDEHRLEGFTFRYRQGASEDSPRVVVHEAHLCGLTPDTEYLYQVGVDGVWSPEYRFRTAPDRGADSSAQVTVLVLGDTRDAPAVFGELLELAETLAHPDVILFTGDAVSGGATQWQWDELFEQGARVLARVPIIVANGNHERNAINFYALAALPGIEERFGIDYGPFHLTVLNDTPSDAATISGSQQAFLVADLQAAAGAPWRFVMHHRAPWSSSRHGSSVDLQDAWGPAIDAHHVDLVFSGHDHDYERTRPLRAGRIAAPQDGTVYLVTGGAGAPLYESGSSWFTASSESVRHFVLLAVRAGRIDGRAIREDGSLLDTFTITR